MRSLSFVLLSSLAACSNPNAITLGSGAPARACTPPMNNEFTGELASSEVAARMLKDNGKSNLRWVQPGTMVTMDYREDRLTVYLDAANRIERVSCS